MIRKQLLDSIFTFVRWGDTVDDQVGIWTVLFNDEKYLRLQFVSVELKSEENHINIAIETPNNY